jgi:AcrR family transcriptional regulator
VGTYVRFSHGLPALCTRRARELRVDKHLSLDEIAERLALPKTTVYYWIRDLPLGRARRASEGQRRGNYSMQNKWRHKREAAYAQGVEEYDELMKQHTFRDFVALYIAEGYKRSRNSVSLCNSDPVIVSLAARWMRRLSGKTLRVRVQHHADQNVADVRAFWAETLEVDGAAVKCYPRRTAVSCAPAFGAASTASPRSRCTIRT